MIRPTRTWFRLTLLLLTAAGVRPTAGASLAAVPDPDDSRPLFLVHYMPWYQAKPFSTTWGYHWTMNHFNPDAVEESGRRPIASHYYPLIGPYDSRDPDVLEYHALLMKVSGIDGVIVDWYGTTDFRDYATLHDATQLAFEVMRDAGLSFAVCYEDQTIGHLINGGRLTPSEAVQHAQEQLAYVEDAWMSDPAYATLDGKPVLLNFGPQYFDSSAEWEQIFSVMDVAPAFFVLHERLEPVSDGAFAWPPMHESRNGTLQLSSLRNYLDLFYAYGNAEWPSFVGGAFPGFHDIYQEAGAGTSYGFLDARDGLTFQETLERALDAGSPIVQLVTWNDFGEGTNIEPTEEYGYRYLEHVQSVVHSLSPLPYSTADLRLPLQIFHLRKESGGDGDQAARVDEAVGLLRDGNPAAARAIVDELTTAIEGRPERPGLSVAVYPSPTRGETTISLAAGTAGRVRAEVFDAAGRRVAVVDEGIRAAGRHDLRWNAAGLAGGVYFLMVQVGAERVVRPLVIQPH